jgi:hypothetical protein
MIKWRSRFLAARLRRAGQPCIGIAACAWTIDGGSRTMSQAGREDKRYQRRLAAAFHYGVHNQDWRRLAAAFHYAAHDQAAQVHEKAAKRYDKHGQPARAEHERRMAAQERWGAVAVRAWAATTGRRVVEPQGHERSGVDLAALLGATVTVLLTLTFGPGAWGPLATIIGLLLLVVLLAFFWRRRPLGEQRWKWELFFVGSALSVVVGFVAAITLAQAIQWRWFRDDTGYTDCRSVAVAQATMTVHDLSDTDPSANNLPQLADAALKYGSTEWPGVENTTLKKAFYDAYYNAVGDCRAGDTFKSLWWIGVPSFLLTLAWWNWNYIKRFTALLGRISRHVIRRL